MKVDQTLELAGLTSNGYELVGDEDPENAPGGVRFGTCAVTTRGAGTAEFRAIAHIVHEGVRVAKLAGSVQEETAGGGSFVELLETKFGEEVEDLRGKIRDISGKLRDPGEYCDI